MNHLILIALLMALFANATASNNVSTHENGKFER